MADEIQQNTEQTTEQEEKSFTQSDVDRIIGERLSREKGKYSDYEGVVEELKKYGYTGEAKEIRETIKNQAAEIQNKKDTDNSIAEVKAKIKDDGASSELTQYLAELQQDNRNIKATLKAMQDKENIATKAQQATEANKVAFQADVDEFKKSEYKDIDLDELNNDADFVDFLQSSNPSMSLVEVYKRYDKYVNGSTNKAVAKIKSGLDRSTSSGKQHSPGNSTGLSSDQKSTVDNWNKENPKMSMTYQEFKENLRK